MDYSSGTHVSPKKAHRPGKGADGAGPPKEDPQPAEVRQLVLDYLSHHLYLSTARALSQPRTPPLTDLTPTPETATVNVNLAPAPRVPLDPNGELDDGEDQMMVEGALDNDHGLADGGSVELGRPVDPDDPDVEMVDDRPPGGHTSQLAPSASTATETSQVDGVSGRVEGKLTDEELSQIEYRRDIHAQILSGNISAALSLIKLHYPTFISSSDPSSSASTNGHDAPPPTVKLPSLSASNGSSTSPLKLSPSLVLAQTPLASPSPSNALPPSSLHPRHVHLNILIQGFIETIRTVALPSPTSNGSSSHSKEPTGTSNGSSPTHPTSMSMSFHSANNGLSTGTSSPSSSTQSLSSTISTKTTSALTQAQQIYALVDKLPNELDREWYRNAVVQVSSLLAYVPPESGPTKAFLGRGKREKLAENVNQALLAHTGHSFQPRIETLVRQTTVIWKELANQGLSTVPPWSKSDGPEWTRLADYLSDHRNFVLRDFLDA